MIYEYLLKLLQKLVKTEVQADHLVRLSLSVGTEVTGAAVVRTTGSGFQLLYCNQQAIPVKNIFHAGNHVGKGAGSNPKSIIGKTSESPKNKSE